MERVMILYSRSVASGGWVTTFLHPAGTSSSESSFTAMSSKVSMQRTSRADDRANKSKHMSRSSPSHVPSTSFVPLPLPPPSRFAFPSPLKFLWFNNRPEEEDPTRTSTTADHEQLSDTSRVDFVKQEIGDGRLDPSRNSSRTTEEDHQAVDMQEELEAASAQFQESAEVIKNAISMAAEETDSVAQESGVDSIIGNPLRFDEVPKPWVQNFVNLGAFWKRQQNTSVPQAAGPAIVDHKLAADSESSSCCGQEFLLPQCGCQGCASSSVGLTADHSSSCIGSNIQEEEMIIMDMAQPPHMTIAQNKDYFSKFLHPVSSSELKRVAHMAHMCTLAYNIPAIEHPPMTGCTAYVCVVSVQPEKLFQQHNLRFRTSSLDIKAAAVMVKVAIAEAEKRRAAAAAVAATLPSTAASASVMEVPESQTGAAAGEKHTKPEAVVGQLLKALISAKAEAHESSSSSHQKSMVDLQELPCFRLGGDGVDELDPLSAVLGVQFPISSSYPAIAHDSEGKNLDPRSVVQHRCPCEWFMCDDQASHTQIFAIQGSESLASWQTNLQFEPTQFEDPGLETMVHRGIYEAAKGLYEQVLPLVQAHMAAHGEDARIRFTGHSLGGSLAMLLSLMLCLRKAIPVSALLPVYTFGSPCIMCGGELLLHKLGLPRSHIQSVVMHLDIVPRTFACDYPDHVTVVLKRMNGNFRNLSCLLQQRLIYGPLGEMVILQPEEDEAPGHSLLPPGSGLYFLRHPISCSQLHPAAAAARTTAEYNKTSHQECVDYACKARQLWYVERAFLNVPHPLDMLTDRNAYGSEGTISRDHDCRNYLRALNRLRLREFTTQLWAPLLGALEQSNLLLEFQYMGISLNHSSVNLDTPSNKLELHCQQQQQQQQLTNRAN